MAAGPTPSQHFDSLTQEVFLGMWRTYDRLRILEDELFRGFSLTAQQYNLLRLLKAEDPRAIPTLTLAGRLVSRAPDITRMVDKLAQRGLVERRQCDQNRRTVMVRIMPAGKRLLAQIAKPLERCHQQQLGHLSVSELTKLNELLKRARTPHESPDSPWR